MSADIGECCAGCGHSQSIPNMREHERGKVFCAYGSINVHANGLCDKYRKPTESEILFPLRRANGNSCAMPRKSDWRASVSAATREPVVPENAPVVSEVPLNVDPLELF